MSSDGKTLFISSGKASGYSGEPSYLFAVDAASGHKIWNFSNPTGISQMASSPTVSADERYVFVGDNKGTVWAINAKTGNIVWYFNQGCNAGGIYARPVLSADAKRVFVGQACPEVFGVQ